MYIKRELNKGIKMKEYQVKVYNNVTEWFFNGKRHREDGPAIEWPDGTKSYWIKGKRHREDGPAIEWPDGSKEYYINGKEYSYEDWIKKFSKNKETVLIDGKEFSIETVKAALKSYSNF
jgi:hypothetical protein